MSFGAAYTSSDRTNQQAEFLPQKAIRLTPGLPGQNTMLKYLPGDHVF